MSFEPVLLLFPLFPLQRMRNCSKNSNYSSRPSSEPRSPLIASDGTVATIATVAVAPRQNASPSEGLASDRHLDVLTCDFETLLAIAQQMPPERFEQIKIERPDFVTWLNRLRANE